MKPKYLIILFFLTAIFASHPAQAQHGTKGRHKPASSVVTSDCPLIDSIIAFAKTKLGCAYRSGGTGPSSFDCSGFMYYTFDHFGIRLGRSSRDQILMGRKVEKKDIRPGDLVFWYRGKGYVGHAGLVVKVDSAHNFTFIHASTHGKGVRLDESTGDWYASTYAGARRIIECDKQHRAQMIQPDGKPSAVPVETPVARDSAQTASPNQPNTPQKAETHTAPAPKIIYHKIKSGETLTSIAKKYHVTVKQIKQWNHLRSDMIRAGEKLKIHRK